MKHVFIINPVSGQRNASAVLRPKILAAAQQLEADVEIVETQYQGHGVELARQWTDWAEKQKEIVRIYACGGDGTLNEVLVGIKGSQWAQVACVPCGSGNDFIRNYGCREDFLNLPDLMEGEACCIDLIETNIGWSGAICSVGLDAQVAYNIPKFRRFPFCGGSMAYYLSIVQQLLGSLGHRLSIEIDGKTIEQDCLMIAICNGSCYGGGFIAAPEARLDDGLLDILIIRKINRLRIAKVLAVYKNGLHLKNGQVREDVRDIIRFERGRQVKLKVLDGKPLVVTLDGECSKQMELNAAVVPQLAWVVLPKKLVAKRKENCYVL